MIEAWRAKVSMTPSTLVDGLLGRRLPATLMCRGLPTSLVQDIGPGGEEGFHKISWIQSEAALLQPLGQRVEVLADVLAECLWLDA